jgi:hypothetical protein
VPIVGNEPVLRAHDHDGVELESLCRVEREAQHVHELERAGAYRVYEDPADLLRHLDEVGVRTAK